VIFWVVEIGMLSPLPANSKLRIRTTNEICSFPEQYQQISPAAYREILWLSCCCLLGWEVQKMAAQFQATLRSIKDGLATT